MLLEQLNWSAARSAGSAEIDAYVLERWLTAGEARGAARELEHLLQMDLAGGSEADRQLENRLVYGPKL